MFYNRHMNPRGQPPMSGMQRSMEAHMSAPPRQPENYFSQPGSAEPSIKINADAPTPTPAPAPEVKVAVATPPAPPSIPTPSTSTTTEKPAMACVIDQHTIHDQTMKGCLVGFFKGLGGAAITGDPTKIASSTVSGCVTGNLKGMATAPQTCVPILPNEPPKPKPKP